MSHQQRSNSPLLLMSDMTGVNATNPEKQPASDLTAANRPEPLITEAPKVVISQHQSFSVPEGQTRVQNVKFNDHTGTKLTDTSRPDDPGAS